KPCSPSELIDVTPWWDLAKKVSICRDDYRSEVTSDHSGGVEQYCEALQGPNPGNCRCGPYLFNCARDEKQNTELTTAVVDEAIKTMEFVMRTHAPFNRVLTMNETVRSERGEVFYARNRYFKTHRLDLKPVMGDDSPTVRPRDPEFSGGLLTTPAFRFFDP